MTAAYQATILSLLPLRPSRLFGAMGTGIFKGWLLTRCVL